MFKHVLINSTRSRHFRQLFRDNVRSEVDSDLISGVVIGQVGMDVHVAFGDSRPSFSRDIRLPHFVTDERRQRHTQYLRFAYKL